MAVGEGDGVCGQRMGENGVDGGIQVLEGASRDGLVRRSGTEKAEMLCEKGRKRGPVSFADHIRSHWSHLLELLTKTKPPSLSTCCVAEANGIILGGA